MGAIIFTFAIFVFKKSLISIASWGDWLFFHLHFLLCLCCFFDKRNDSHKLTYEHIEHVLDQYKTVADRITKKKAYIVTMLYNATLEADSHMTNLYHSDRIGGRE